MPAGLPGGSGDERGHDVGGVPVQGGPGALWRRQISELSECLFLVGRGAAADVGGVVRPVIAAGVAEGEAADDRWPLGVEEDEQAGDAVFGFEGAVVQQPAGLLPASLGVDCTGGAAPPGGGKVQARQLVLAGPADEVPGTPITSGAVAGVNATPARAYCLVMADRKPFEFNVDRYTR